MAFAREAQGVGEPPPEAGPPPDPGAAAGGEDPAAEKAEEAERAKARSKIWTPPGA
jgi:hypothetical protein